MEMCPESLLKPLIKIYGWRTVCGDRETWYPEARISLGLENRLPSSYEKSIVERRHNTTEYLKEATKVFDDFDMLTNG